MGMITQLVEVDDQSTVSKLVCNLDICAGKCFVDLVYEREKLVFWNEGDWPGCQVMLRPNVVADADMKSANDLTQTESW